MFTIRSIITSASANRGHPARRPQKRKSGLEACATTAPARHFARPAKSERTVNRHGRRTRHQLPLLLLRVPPGSGPGGRRPRVSDGRPKGHGHLPHVDSQTRKRRAVQVSRDSAAGSTGLHSQTPPARVDAVTARSADDGVQRARKNGVSNKRVRAWQASFAPGSRTSRMARPPGKPFEGASGNGRGFSQGGPYLNGSIVRQFPKQPPMGAVEPSYDPNARPASATRKVDCAAERVSLPAKGPGATTAS
jgi:hypothetical protein